ncbi:MAG: hypothetical protein AAF533_20140 [Acidobacteriota bacterium]
MILPSPSRSFGPRLLLGIAVLLLSPGARAAGCGSVPAAVDDRLAPGAVTVIGDIRGTQEIPRFVGEMACEAASVRGLPVMVALELPIDMQAAVDLFLASPGKPTDRAALLKHEVWALPDARGSEAVVELLDRLRVLAQATDLVQVVTTSAGHDVERESGNAMALVVDQAIQARPDSVVLVLTQASHAQVLIPWLAGCLQRTRENVLGVRIWWAGGTIWATTDANTGVARIRGKDRGASPFLKVYDLIDHGYEGALYVGTVTASPPARRTK